jgi:hypothetical protein
VIASTVHPVLASGSPETAGVQLEILVPESPRKVDVGVDVQYMDMGKANGMMFFQCEEPALLAGVNRTQPTNRRGRSCKLTV